MSPPPLLVVDDLRVAFPNRDGGTHVTAFKQALTVMGDLYASALGVTVLISRTVASFPVPRPPSG